MKHNIEQRSKLTLVRRLAVHVPNFIDSPDRNIHHQVPTARDTVQGARAFAILDRANLGEAHKQTSCDERREGRGEEGKDQDEVEAIGGEVGGDSSGGTGGEREGGQGGRAKDEDQSLHLDKEEGGNAGGDGLLRLAEQAGGFTDGDADHESDQRQERHGG